MLPASVVDWLGIRPEDGTALFGSEEPSPERTGHGNSPAAAGPPTQMERIDRD